MDYELNKRYFKEITNSLQKKIIIAGAILFLIGITGVSELIIFGIILIAGGIVWINMNKKKIVSDEAYDASVVSYLDDSEEKALNKLGVDEDEVNEIEPIRISSYAFSKYQMAKKGEDDLWRTNKYESVYLFFSQNEVHCYKIHYNTIKKEKTESTDVYFYSDIVSVSTTSEEVKLSDVRHGEKETTNYEAFQLTTTGGTALRVGIRDQDTAQRSINAMRSLLRAKKTQQQVN